MVKHAAIDETSPLLTAEERVNAAVAEVTADRQLTDEQAKWMEYIRQHLVQNLSDRAGGLRGHSRSCPIAVAGDEPTESSTGSSTNCLTN